MTRFFVRQGIYSTMIIYNYEIFYGITLTKCIPRVDDILDYCALFCCVLKPLLMHLFSAKFVYQLMLLCHTYIFYETKVSEAKVIICFFSLMNFTILSCYFIASSPWNNRYYPFFTKRLNPIHTIVGAISNIF